MERIEDLGPGRTPPPVDRNAQETTPLQGEDQFSEQPNWWQTASGESQDRKRGRMPDFGTWNLETLIAYARKIGIEHPEELPREALLARIREEGLPVHFSI